MQGKGSMVTWWLVGQQKHSRDSLTGMNITQSEGAINNISSSNAIPLVFKSNSSSGKIQEVDQCSDNVGINSTEPAWNHRMQGVLTFCILFLNFFCIQFDINWIKPHQQLVATYTRDSLEVWLLQSIIVRPWCTAHVFWHHSYLARQNLGSNGMHSGPETIPESCMVAPFRKVKGPIQVWCHAPDKPVGMPLYRASWLQFMRWPDDKLN